jgi:hypothetical protein
MSLLAGSDFDSSDRCCLGSVITSGHIDGYIRIIAGGLHYRLSVLSKIPANCKEKGFQKI